VARGRETTPTPRQNAKQSLKKSLLPSGEGFAAGSQHHQILAIPITYLPSLAIESFPGRLARKLCAATQRGRS
jgi:hypothetical protein